MRVQILFDIGKGNIYTHSLFCSKPQSTEQK